MERLKEDKGTGLVEYVVLVAFLAFILVGVLTKLGKSTNEKLCYATLNHNGGDGNGDGVVDQDDIGHFGSDISNTAYDYDCDGLVEFYNSSGRSDEHGRPLNGDDWHILEGWTSEN